MLQVRRPDTVVHPGTMMVHAAYAAIANAAMMRVQRFKGLTLPTHAVGVFQQSLPFARNCLDRDTSWIGEGRLGMTGQSHATQDSINHPQNDGNAFGNGQQNDGKGTVQH
jgi:hypothetical protein